jgi:hypothetical protein
VIRILGLSNKARIAQIPAKMLAKVEKVVSVKQNVKEMVHNAYKKTRITCLTNFFFLQIGKKKYEITGKNN